MRLTESKLVRKAVRQAQQGDIEALHFLYVRYAADVLRHLRKLMPGDPRAEDITQRVFTESIALIKGYEEQKGPFIAWLSGVARDAALEHVGTARHSRHEAGQLRDRSHV